MTLKTILNKWWKWLDCDGKHEKMFGKIDSIMDAHDMLLSKSDLLALMKVVEKETFDKTIKFILDNVVTSRDGYIIEQLEGLSPKKVLGK